MSIVAFRVQPMVQLDSAQSVVVGERLEDEDGMPPLWALLLLPVMLAVVAVWGGIGKLVRMSWGWRI